MVSQQILEEIKNRLVRVYNPREIYLFGSQAWGRPTEDSDVDLFIVVDSLSPADSNIEAKGHRALIGLRVAKDIIVCPLQAFQERILDETSLCYEIKHKGKLIYAKS